MAGTRQISTISSAHFIGIGGAGMSGIALVLHERGCTVTGSDLKASHYVRDLEEAGIPVRIGHEASTIDEVAPDVVVTSSAIPDTNPELARARALGIAVWPRAKMLAALGVGAQTIAIAGTHGKTTTSSMVASMLDHLGMDPSFLIGGVIEEYGTNGRDGKGGYFVCEADESDGSFLFLDPSVVVVTNIEADHLDHYGSLENIERTFCEFMGLVGDGGTVIVDGDVDRYVELARSTGRRTLTYGFAEGNDYVCVPVPSAPSAHGLESRGVVRLPSGDEVTLCLTANPGAHNLANATAALAVADVLGCDVAAAAAALHAFKGAHRRFTHVGDVAGVTVVDDYGHHPTEIRATLAAASDLPYDRIVTVFQPHRYTRTQAFMDDFARAFDQADLLVVTEVFPAGEMPIPGVSGRVLASRVAELSGEVEAVSIDRRRDVINYLCGVCRPGDLVITQGAGDVTSIGPDLIAALRERAGLEA
ncbi:MAG: UDP-N-acetylmuramate--L-alanine ligase [Acidobacteriota bacterium]|nr:UDP-N-acetylmuramate--L-alanine ligase [Acidobacteriota bacterium]